MEKDLEVGSAVIYLDELRTRHHALVTHVWTASSPHGCNLLFVVGDVDKIDPYGRQIERRTSVVHKTMNPAKANCWAWPNEVE